MKRYGWLALALLAGGCDEVRQVRMSFGEEGEGLDGFLCREDESNAYLLERAQPRAGAASLVVDFIELEGAPGCRSGQLIRWCATHDCRVLAEHRTCTALPLPNVEGAGRDVARARVLEAFRGLSGSRVSSDAPDRFLIVRATATLQPCDSVLPSAEVPLPELLEDELVGCAYSCPVLLDQLEQDVFLGFDTLTEKCAQGVRVCASGSLRWEP